MDWLTVSRKGNSTSASKSIPFDQQWHACPAWKLAADTCLLKRQRLRNKILRTSGKFPRRAPVRDLRLALKVPYVYDFVTKLCRSKQKSYRVIIIQMLAI
jgi:hypothetical protein